MQYEIENSGHVGHHALIQVLWYLVLVGGGLLAVYEHMPGLIVVLCVAAGLALSVPERVRKLPGPGRSVSVAPSGLPLGDGGCFPGGAPLRERPTEGRAVVIDGGSLEHEPGGRSVALSTSRHCRWCRPTRVLSTLHQHP
jgi:hypothetical protein